MFEKLKFPANTMMVTSYMITLATFELIPTDDLFEEIFYFPELEPFSESFETCDLETNLFLSNIGFMLVIILLHVLFVILHASIHYFRNSGKLINKVYNKLGPYLYWNGLLRLYMEMFFEIELLSTLNLHMANWNT